MFFSLGIFPQLPTFRFFCALLLELPLFRWWTPWAGPLISSPASHIYYFVFGCDFLDIHHLLTYQIFPFGADFSFLGVLFYFLNVAFYKRSIYFSQEVRGLFVITETHRMCGAGGSFPLQNLCLAQAAPVSLR